MYSCRRPRLSVYRMPGRFPATLWSTSRERPLELPPRSFLSLQQGPLALGAGRSVGGSRYRSVGGRPSILVCRSAEALGLAPVMHDVPWEMKIRVWADSPPAKAVAGRLGVGRTLHIGIRFPWLREMICQRRLDTCKIRGDLNLADAVTKPKLKFRAQGHFRAGQRPICGVVRAVAGMALQATYKALYKRFRGAERHTLAGGACEARARAPVESSSS